MSYKQTVDISGAIKKTKTLKKIPDAARRQLTSWGGKAKKKIIRNISGPILGRYESGRKTGQLRRSIKYSISVFGQAYRLEVGSKGVKYARILEKGGVIRPKRAKMLAIPLRGVQGVPANYRGRGSFIMKTKRGKLLIAQRRGKNLAFLFVLKKQVTIPKFQWLEQSVHAMRPLLYRMMRSDELLKIAGRL